MSLIDNITKNMVLPPYEPPPPYIPPSERLDHPDYIGNVKDYLPRTVTMVRSQTTEALGFNIRGGKEHYCGIYVSKVMDGSNAQRLGVKEADQILSVNGVDFTEIEHPEAVKVLKMNTTISMDLRFFPYGAFPYQPPFYVYDKGKPGWESQIFLSTGYEKTYDRGVPSPNSPSQR